MKLPLLLPLLVCLLSVGFARAERNLTIHDLLTQQQLDQFADVSVQGIFDLEINPLFDVLLDNLREIIVEDHLDPLPLDDQELKLLGILGSLQLTTGSLQQFSTIKRDDDIVISLSTSRKTITFTLPLGFDELAFKYHFKTRITLLSASGDVEGKISNAKLTLQVTYDPSAKALSLDSLSMRNSGKVTVKFTGNVLVDWLTNAMTGVVTTVLHPIIVLVVQTVVKALGGEVIDAINQYIQSVFPN